jgi:hypothetical protein
MTVKGDTVLRRMYGSEKGDARAVPVFEEKSIVEPGKPMQDRSLRRRIV